METWDPNQLISGLNKGSDLWPFLFDLGKEASLIQLHIPFYNQLSYIVNPQKAAAINTGLQKMFLN